jgi:GNAT superfamily N-acetyltransferase
VTVLFRDAVRADVPAVVDLLRDDTLGSAREAAGPGVYLQAFEAMAAEGGNTLVVGMDGDRIVATYQITFISGLSLQAARRAQVESVRVAGDRRGQGIGQAMFADAEARARAAGCALMQLTMNASRTESARFYQGLGFAPSHVGFKKRLN